MKSGLDKVQERAQEHLVKYTSENANLRRDIEELKGQLAEQKKNRELLIGRLLAFGPSLLAAIVGAAVAALFGHFWLHQ